MYRALIVLSFCALFAMPAMAQHQNYHMTCPDPKTVQLQPIPHSSFSLFHAKSGTLEFNGFGRGWDVDTPLFETSIVQEHGSFHIRCSYMLPNGDHFGAEKLVSQNSHMLYYCHFPQGWTCRGSREACVLSCWFPPQPDHGSPSFAPEASEESSGD